MKTLSMLMDRMSGKKTTTVKIDTDSHTIKFLRVPLERGCPVLTQAQAKKYGEIVTAYWRGHEIYLEVSNCQN